MKATILNTTIKVPVRPSDPQDEGCGCNNPVKKLWQLVPKLLNGKDKEVYRFSGVEVEVRKV